jgi:hypothetical protein
MKRFLLFCVCTFSIGLLNAMEEQPSQITILESLPAELQLCVLQYLGGSVKETIKNLVSLGQVDRTHYENFLEDPQVIKRLVTRIFGKEGIARALIKALRESDNLKQVLPFLDLQLIKPEDTDLLFTVDPDWFQSLIYTWSINVNSQQKYAHPSSYVKEYKSLKAQYKTTQKYEFLRLLVLSLIKRQIVDPNKQYNGKTMLDHAAEIRAPHNEVSLSLMSMGADIKQEVNRRAVSALGLLKEDWMRTRISIKKNEKFGGGSFFGRDLPKDD